MRTLTLDEMQLVAGAGGDCSSEGDGDDGNTYGGVSDVGGIGQDIIDAYEGLIEATSYIIERVANSF